jgi:transcriptional regulator
MYTPPAFAANDLARLHDAIERYSFAVLVSGQGEDLVATHVPLLLDRSAGPRGTLIGHVARANPQWQLADGSYVLAIFSGPHAYISPTWYAADRTVPTWNYVAVHAYGKLQVISDDSETLAVLKRTVETFESAFPEPWQLAAQPPDFIDKLAGQIVAFRIPLDRLEGKWKLNQNHPPERRERVAAALENAADDNSREIARLMRERP